MPTNEYTRQDFRVYQPIPGLAMVRALDQDIFLIAPDKVERTDNMVVATYGDYEQVITAEGEGDERHNFRSVVRRRSSS